MNPTVLNNNNNNNTNNSNKIATSIIKKQSRMHNPLFFLVLTVKKISRLAKIHT
jgi:hypothetical protein